MTESNSLDPFGRPGASLQNSLRRGGAGHLKYQVKQRIEDAEVESTPDFDKWIEPPDPVESRAAIVKRVVEAPITTQLLDELFAEHREEPHTPAVIAVTVCSRCQEVRPYDEMTAKSVLFESLDPSKKGLVRRRLVSWLCELCLVNDRDYRRPEVGTK